MPAPGSNRYDQELHRRVSRLEEQGRHDEDAERLARRSMAGDTNPTWPAAAGDRARGPYGNRGGGGDPGNVIDLRSPAFSSNTTIPPKYARDGDNVSPPLEWSNIPDGTVELALICEDPDAPSGTFTHWIVTGIDPTTGSVGEGSEPPRATDWQNDFGNEGYDGPQPPVGDDPHRYFFRLFALDAPVTASRGDLDELRESLDEHQLASGTLVGLYAR